MSALNISVPDTSMNLAGSRKPYVPLSRSSIVYVYLTPANPFTQSSELPEATSAHVARMRRRCRQRNTRNAFRTFR